jgi:Fe-S-cluster containining protein
MHLAIVSAELHLALDTAQHNSAIPRQVPCHRCGVCCERWQPLLTTKDADRLAARLGLATAEFHETYTSSYPFDDEQRLLRQDGGRCVFLTYDQDSRATCTVHDARPAVCREWSAGLEKKECRSGLERFAQTGLIRLEDLYPDPADRQDFARSVQV